jgi:DNA gyrase subunit A
LNEPPAPPPPESITPISIEEEMKRSYLDYAMSVIVSRALPDVRDGLKPVHRRILYAMKEGGYGSSQPFRKSARIVGDVMGKYHPHGDTAIYDAMVRMAQDFSMRVMLVEGQGNFGSMDGDPPAAMRYTEARLDKAAESMLDDIDKETVDYQPNYDESSQEPVVLPAKFPNLLVNGAGGIAVGMATNMPTHNLGEVVDACLATIDNPDVSIDELMELLPGPDFPTGGLIMGVSGIRAAYHLGRGSIIMRGRTEIEPLSRDREAIIVTEIPYQVNKSRMIERIAEVVNDKLIEGIGDLRDESDRHGVRVVIELKRDAMSEVVLNQLYRYTPLQTTFGVNALSLNGGQPQMLTLKQIIEAFVAFREEVINRRTAYELRRARERAHILVGLAIAVANLDPLIALIRKAKDAGAAREALMAQPWPASDVAPLVALLDEPGRGVVKGKYQFSEAQARAILELRLHRLTGLEREKIAEELNEVAARIKDYLDILATRDRVLTIMRDELAEMKEQFATPRRTALMEGEHEHDIEDLIQREEMVVTVSHSGYIKRVPLSTYRAQRRGGKGRAGMATREEDFVAQVFVVNTHTPVLFFSSRGMVYKLKTYRLPQGTPQARGKPLVNVLPLDQGETISTLMPLPEDEESWGDLFVMFATSNGTIRRNSLADFVNVKANGKIAMKLEPGEWLVSVQTCDANDDVLLAARGGKCIRFPVTDVRVFTGRTSRGVRGIKLAKGDEVMSMSILRHVEATPEAREDYLKAANAKRRADVSEPGQRPAEEAALVAKLETGRFSEMAAQEEFILAVTENGYGKRSSSFDYRIAQRGGQGIGNIETSARNGKVAATFPVSDTDGLVLVTDGGKIIRVTVAEISIMGRRTQGVRIFSVGDRETVVSVTRMSEDGAGGDNGDGENPDGDNADGDSGEDAENV